MKKLSGSCLHYRFFYSQLLRVRVLWLISANRKIKQWSLHAMTRLKKMQLSK